MLWERIQFWVVLIWMVALLVAAIWALRLLMQGEPPETREEPPSATRTETNEPPKDAP